MSKILITILSHDIDIIGSSHLICSLKEEHPHHEISVLTYSDLLTYFSAHAGISEVYSIDRNFAKGIAESSLYSDSFALNSFFNSIAPCYDIHWNKVINYSNDTVASYLCSMMTTDDMTGTSISKLGSAQTSNVWSNYLNFVSPNIEEDIIPSHLVRHYMSSVPFRREGKKIKLNNEFTQVATTNFSRIRQSMPTNLPTFMVGISLSPSFGGDSICKDSISEVIEALEESENFKPVLILSGSENEKNLVGRLNERFGNKLISINTDRTAFPSVALNLDFLVSQSNEHLMFADAIETRTIELRSSTKMKRRSSLVNSDNFVIYQGEELLSNDILVLLNQETNSELPISSMHSSNKVYMTTEDDYGFLMTQIRGPVDLEEELRYHIERSYHFQLMGFTPNEQFITHLRDSVDPVALSTFITQSKDELTNSVKLLLATLRSLKGAKQSQGNLKNFVLYLDQIIKKAKSTSITRGAIGLFEGRIESINSENPEENMKLIEKHLFSLKSDLQALTNLLTDLISVEQKEDTTEATR
jgi:hypothetical protein